MRPRDGLMALREVVVDGCPVVPDTWLVFAEGDTGWCTLHSPAGVLLASLHMGDVTIGGTTRGVFGVFSENRALLDSLDESANVIAKPAGKVWAAAQSGPGLARTVLSAHSDWYINGAVRRPAGLDDGATAMVPVSNHKVRLFPPRQGFAVPLGTGMPHRYRADGSVTAVPSEAAIRVDAYVRPALVGGIAGWADAEALEDTE